MGTAGAGGGEGAEGELAPAPEWLEADIRSGRRRAAAAVRGRGCARRARRRAAWGRRRWWDLRRSMAVGRV